MKLNEKQEMNMRNVKKADELWRNAKKDAAARAKMVADKEVADYLANRDREVRLAFEAGVPQLQIGRDGLGTTSPIAVRESLARTAGVVAALAAQMERDPYAGRYQWDAPMQRLVVTLTDQAFADAITRADFDITPAAAEKAGLNTAIFEVCTRADGSQFIQSETVRWMPEYLNSHPVVMWSDVAANQAEMLAWYEKEVVA